jgi:hypothetical protein
MLYAAILTHPDDREELKHALEQRRAPERGGKRKREGGER